MIGGQVGHWDQRVLFILLCCGCSIGIYLTINSIYGVISVWLSGVLNRTNYSAIHWKSVIE